MLTSYWKSGGKVPCILNLSTRWNWVVSFMSWPLNPQGKNPYPPFSCRLSRDCVVRAVGQEVGWTTVPVWVLWWREKSYHAGNWTPVVIAHSLITILIGLFWLPLLHVGIIKRREWTVGKWKAKDHRELRRAKISVKHLYLLPAMQNRSFVFYIWC
jgi:hypothetical protein